jgi:hypothetical protein
MFTFFEFESDQFFQFSRKPACWPVVLQSLTRSKCKLCLLIMRPTKNMNGVFHFLVKGHNITIMDMIIYDLEKSILRLKGC